MDTDKISIIIVTFNVSKFITFCIDSIFRSVYSGGIEVIVVDNHSSDDTVSIIEQEFPEISIIQNASNLGFSKACNQGAERSEGDFLLFLNPDCIISEYTLQNLHDCFQNQKVGGVGPLLIDGTGHVLAESARELPSTKSAVTKLFKLPFEKAFPYYRIVDTQDAMEAPILCGACMMLRKEVFVQLKGFDERFFMYGEDIDLSLRLYQAGYTNYCVPQAQVIHFKGESTDRRVMKNNSNFYKAISLYAEKHSGSFASSYRKIGLNFIAKVFPIVRFVKAYTLRAFPLILDCFLILITFFLIQFGWSFYKYGNLYYFGVYKYFHLYFGFTLIWLVTLIYQGVYFSNAKTTSVYKGALIGGIVNLALFALMPFEWRFSRAVLLLSTIIVPLLISAKYGLFNRFYNLERLFVTDKLVTELGSLMRNYKGVRIVEMDTIEEKGRAHNYILDFNNVEIEKIIGLMRSTEKDSKFDFYDRGRSIMFSSDGQDRRGELVRLDAFMNLSQKKFLLQKRTLDILIAFLIIIPISIVKMILLRFDFSKIAMLLSGRLTSVGFGEYDVLDNRLPAIPQSVIRCFDDKESQEVIKDRCMDYAFNYSIFEDLFLIGMNGLSFIRAFI